MNIVLFGGSFNPIHNGHLALARYMSQQNNVDEVWLLLSPQNPLKHLQMVSNEHRIEMIRIAIRNVPKLKLCDIELSLPKPNYTYETLRVLKKKYPEYSFSLLIGEDNLAIFQQWKNYEEILENHQIFVYPRKNEKEHSSLLQHNNIRSIKAPIFPISSTEIREKIASNKNIASALPTGVYEFILQHKIY
ncbi:MAG: nicotinate-nucleotide adenylyltransferase [Paludibacteraceae bacterium]|nr:nicotinate-nucleotide adenylyltransferase [Paludibacteraceae bacterium]MBO7316553.1 nicotinate-nucleotide adenylyltransferase [Paludibacteraceae bacterium]